VVTSVNDKIYSDEQFSIYPNPSSDYLILEFNSIAGKEGKIEVTDINGKILCTKALAEKKEERTFTISTQSFSSGIYFLKISSGSSISVKKFIIEK